MPSGPSLANHQCQPAASIGNDSPATGSLYDFSFYPYAVAAYRSLPATSAADAAGNLGNPYGTGSLQFAAPKSPKSSDLSNYLPNLAAISDGAQPVSLGVYDRRSKLPYTYNYTLDIQWQPRNDLAIELGYVGNLGRHQVIPVPFNQPGIAALGYTIHGETLQLLRL